MTIRMLEMVLSTLLWMCGSAGAHAGTVTYVYTDPQGTPLAEADASGTITARFDYAPYGQSVASMGAAPNGPGYTGHVNDPDTGLVYMQARYYDPAVGRFLSVDPVGPAVGNISNFNRYAYANGNPVVNVDPDGRNGVTAFGGLLYETGQFLQGNGFDGKSVLGALKDGYDGEGDGVAYSAFQDATSFIPAGAIVGTAGKLGLLVREAGLLAKTVEGATRIGATSLRGGALGRAEIAATRVFGKQFVQNNNARAYVTKTANGKFNVAFFGKNGYITSMKNLSEKSLLKQAVKYEWKEK